MGIKNFYRAALIGVLFLIGNELDESRMNIVSNPPVIQRNYNGICIETIRRYGDFDIKSTKTNFGYHIISLTYNDGRQEVYMDKNGDGDPDVIFAERVFDSRREKIPRERMIKYYSLRSLIDQSR